MRCDTKRCDEKSSTEKGRDAVEADWIREWNGGLHDLPCSRAATAASHLRRKSISLDGQLQGNGPLNSFIIIRRQAGSGLGFSVSLSVQLGIGFWFRFALRLPWPERMMAKFSVVAASVA